MSGAVSSPASAAERDALLALLLAEEGLTAAESAPLRPRADRTAPAPLSFAQQRLWFLQQFEPASTAYHVPGALRLVGELDEAALAAAWQALAERHEVLRTTFAARAEEGGEEPVQVVGRGRLGWAVEDFSREVPEMWQARVQERLRAEAAAPFDLSRGPLARARLLRGSGEKVLLVTMHHIVSDQWSLGIMADALAAEYARRKPETGYRKPETAGIPAEVGPDLRAGRGQNDPAPRGAGHDQPCEQSLAVQYADFAIWQREWARGEACAAQLAYWRKQLEGVTPLELPTDFPRPAKPSARGGTVGFAIEASTRVAVERLAQTEGATAFMVLLATFKALLHRYTSQPDIAVGSPVTGRSRPETAPLIGFFTNTLVLRTAITGEASFKAVVRAVKETCLAGFAHQEVPFELVVETLQPVRELNRNPFFDAMFVLQTPLPTVTPSGVRAEFLPTEIPDAKFDLTLTLREVAGGGFEGWIEYRAELFAVETIQRMAEHFGTLLRGAVSRPDLPVLDLPLLGAEERRRVLEEFNATSRPYTGSEVAATVPVARPEDVAIGTIAATHPSGQDGSVAGEPLLHALVEAWVGRTPDKLALVDPQERITYRELERRANQLAHRLRELGVGPEVIVGLSLGRTLDMVVGVLGVLKAGGAYLPLDPAYPAERVAYMLEDAQAPVVVTHAESRGQLALPANVRQIDLDAEAATLARLPATRPVSGVGGGNLLYVIYTSGSTGKPKGTTLTHAAMYNLLRWHFDTLLTGARGLMFASLSFDVSFYDIFAVLGSGGELHIATEEHRGDIAALVTYLERERIEKLVLPVVVFQQIAADYADQPHRFAALRELSTTGEALILTPAILAWCRAVPHCRFHNQYGPAETHVVTAFTFEGPPAALNPPPPIGRSVANTQIYVLDPRMNPVPIGVPGELYIGGANLGRDYYRRPELTAQKFIPNPFSREPGARLYRTGDRARWRTDGNLEFFGRLDDQVKIRGFRVELGEVETQLVKHPAVSGAAVAVRERAPGDRVLAGFFVRAPGATVSPAELRSFLAAHLPDYMVPAVLVELQTLPLTPSGKIHRRSLPALEAAHFASATVHVPPASEAERFVAEVWAELLGVPRVGRDDHFFQLGGHSLLATRVVSRLRARTTLEFPLRLLFEHPTLARFTAALAEIAGGATALDGIVQTVRAVESMSAEEVARLQ